MKVNTSFGTYDVSLERSKYTYNDNLAIQLWCDDEGYPEPFAMLTVNLPNYGKLPENQAFVDTNNCSWAESFIKENRLGKPVGKIGISGWCEYPLYEFIEWEGELV